MKIDYVKPDSRRRIVLGKKIKDLASLYKIYQKDNKIILEPVIEIPEKERWLFDPKNLELVKELKRRLEEEKATVDWDKIKHKYS